MFDLARLKEIIDLNFAMPCFPNGEVEAEWKTIVGEGHGRCLEIRILGRRRVMIAEDGTLVRHGTGKAPVPRSEALSDFLHLHAQPYWHSDAYIVGTRGELESLLGTLKLALESGHSACQPFAQDGEGYTLHVLCVDGDDSVQHATPYTDECAVDQRDNAVWPHTLVKPKESKT